MTTNVPPPTFGPSGFVAPLESAILAGVIADLNAAFGGNLNPSLSTPQGQIASSDAAIIGSTNDAFLFLAQMFDPAFSEGRFQDALARIWFLTRNPAQSTVVQGTCRGSANVVIPVGALAIAADGNIYSCLGQGIIPVGGSIVLSFACIATGPIQCPAGTLSQIYKAIPGWDSITNLSDGVIGNAVEARGAFEGRRRAAAAKNSINALQSILGAVLAVPNVLDAYVAENPTSQPIIIGNYTLAPHSISVAAVGGIASAVAAAIWSKKPPGCNYNGNTTIVVQDTSSGYSPPYPSYNVTFQIPAPLSIFFLVTLSSQQIIPSNALALIQAAVISAFAGGDGGPRARIGSSIFASRFYTAVAGLGAWAQIVEIKIGSANTAATSFTASISGAVLTVAGVLTGSLAVGQVITDLTGIVAPGTTIVSLGSGTGGAGTYNLSASQTVASQAMFGVSPNQDVVAVNLNQTPVISAADIALAIA